ncbi:MAG: CotH kinase family protein, partial [Chloroflexota bacterium]|nr:CotH kinase family protein [Chloroflexota bacterium]
MRIRSKSSSERRSRWSAIKSWLRSRRIGLQLLLAFGLGTIVAGGVGLWYIKSGKTWIATLTAPLHAEAQKTVEEVTVTNDLPILYFDIGFVEFQTLAAQREEALQKGVLMQDDDDWVRAQIRFQGETISVRLRLKGDWPDHLEEKKWSFRVKTRNDATLLGMRSFSVQAPYTRSHLNEWLYYEDLRQAGILAPRYSFVNVVVNGESWGLYALEESFSKELLESQGRRESVIVRFNEDLLWKQRALYIKQTGHWYN